jgi:arginine/ornithine N-succinyltransferase beta subunit
MFIHQVQRQVPSTIASHLRGSFDPDGTAPFWDCFGHHFTDAWIDSVAAERALAEDPARLDDLVGHRRAVTADVLHSLGPVNQASLPAFRLLMREGLRPNGMYDPIDGGPTLVAERERTVTSQHRVHGRAVIDDDLAAPIDSLVAVTNVDRFRVMHVPVSVGEDDRITVDQATAEALHIVDGALLAAAAIGGL